MVATGYLRLDVRNIEKGRYGFLSDHPGKGENPVRNLTVSRVFWARLLSLVFIAVLSQFLTHIEMMLATTALLFAHYPLAFFFSFRKMSQVTRGWKVWRSLIFIFTLSLVLLFLDPFHWGLYFAIHHALTEAFILPEETTPAENIKYFPYPFIEEILRIGFHSFVYCFAVRSSFNFDWLHSPWLIAMAGICFVSLCTFFPKKGNWVHLGFGWTPLLISFFVPVYFYYFLMYHVLIWVLFPIVSQFKIERHRVQLHVLSNVVGTLLCLFLLFVWLDPFRYETWEFCQPYLMAGTYIHITGSLALSSLNPLWIRRIFS